MFGGWSANRGQTAVIGNLLLVAVGLVLVTVVAVVGIGVAEDVQTDAPSVDVQTLVEESDVFVRHGSGDVLETTDIEVVLKPPGADYRVPLENFRGLSDGEFSSGDSGRLAHGVSSGEITVLVVHEPSNAIIDRVTRRVTDGQISLAAFDAAVSDNDYASGQSGTGTTTVADGGRTVRLTGNQWKYIDYSYNVTADTVLTFEFKSTAEGDIHGIGLEDSTGGQDDQRVVRVYGTQDWGINVTADGESYYEQSDGWRRYTVSLGSLYDARNRLGQASSLVVVMDCDTTDAVESGTPDDRCASQTADGEPTATAYFRNIEIYEAD